MHLHPVTPGLGDPRYETPYEALMAVLYLRVGLVVAAKQWVSGWLIFGVEVAFAAG